MGAARGFVTHVYWWTVTEGSMCAAACQTLMSPSCLHLLWGVGLCLSAMTGMHLEVSVIAMSISKVFLGRVGKINMRCQDLPLMPCPP